MADISYETRYPAIVSSINARRPNREDVRKVALRIYREVREADVSQFRQLRRAVAIARAALGIGERRG